MQLLLHWQSRADPLIEYPGQQVTEAMKSQTLPRAVTVRTTRIVAMRNAQYSRSTREPMS